MFKKHFGDQIPNYFSLSRNVPLEL